MTLQGTSVGVIGVGALGAPVAARLLQAGCATAVFDVRAEPVQALAALGAVACTSPAEVAARSDFIVSLVADAAQTGDVLHGAHGVLKTLRPGTVVIIGSTLGPEPVIEAAAAIAAAGGDTLDAPISGGLVAAREGTLSVMVGGAPEVLERAAPVLATFARAVTRAGAVGAGQSAKLAHQLVFSVNVMALLEGLALGTAGGVAPAVMKQILGEGIANSRVLELWPDLGPRWKNMLQATPPAAPLPNLRKDLHMALDLARALGVPVYLGAQGSLIADAGVATGHTDPAL